MPVYVYVLLALTFFCKFYPFSGKIKCLDCYFFFNVTNVIQIIS